MITKNQMSHSILISLIGFAVYNVTTLCLIGVPASSLLAEDNVDTRFAITATLIIVCTTITQCLVFLPKVGNRSVLFSLFLSALHVSKFKMNVSVIALYKR